MYATHFFGKRSKHRVFLRILKKNNLLGEKRRNPACFQGPHEMGINFLGRFFFGFFLFSVSFASSKRVFQKKNYFYRFLNTLLKNLETSCSNNQLNPQHPQEKCTTFFLGKPFFWPKATFKDTNFAPPPQNCALKKQKKAIFIGSKKRWPSYWPWGGQVVDPEMAKKWPSYWPCSIYVYWESQTQTEPPQL